MKVGMKKALSLLLALCVIFSVFAGLATTVGAATYSYNTGTRGEVCTSLSSKAKSYYTSSYAYSTLSKQSASTLKSSLKSLMTNTHKTKTTYENLKTYTKYSDAVAGSSSKIYDFYSSATYSGKWDSGETWNREHVWCQSLGSFTTSNCGSDLHHLRPTDPKLNSTRNNSPFGEVSGSYKTATSNSGKVGGYYTSSYFEPLDNVKGDIARILLYCHVRWGESNITKLISSTDTLLSWMKQDPVDTWEMGRNDVVQEIQGNRNVFIDYPEYAWLIYSKSIPSHTTPSGMAKGGSSSGGSNSGTTTYKVTATTNNSSYGTVSVSGYKIACSPKTGYKVGSATVTSGTATTSISGNTVTVNPSTNCTVRVNFVSSGSGSSSSSSGSTFTLVTSASQLKDGDKVIIVAANYSYAMSTTQNTNNRSQTNITKDSSTVTATSSTEVFTLGKSGSYYTFYDSSEDGYLRAASSSANQLKTGTLDNNAKWSISISSGNASIVAQGSYTRKYMRHNVSSGIFACYSSSSSQYPVAIYRQGGTSSGSTTCSHSSTSTSTTNATCTASGKTTVTCKSCGVVVSTTTIPALGHSYKYTSNSNGTHKVTCSRCSYSSSASCTYSNNTCKYCGYSKSSSGSGSTSSGSVSVSAGQYVIAAKVGSTYYAMSNSFASKISATEITVSNGKVSASNAEGYVVNIAKSGTSYTISNGSKYLTYSSSSNFSSSTSAYKWNISAGTNGTYRITASGSSSRGIVFYRSYTRFGAYAVSNCTADSSYYYDVELLPVTGTSSSGGSSSDNSGSGSSSSGSTSSGTNTYELVTSASQLTAGTYVIVVSADGTYAGSYSHYALTTKKDGSYSAMSAQGLDFGSLPSSITCSASSASTYEWTLSGSRTSFKLAGGGSYLAGASGSTKLTLSSSATTWSASYSSSYKGFTVKGNSRYISFRDDISTVGSNNLPLFCTVSSTSTGAAYLHFYKLAG